MLIFVQMPPILAKKEKTIKNQSKNLSFPFPNQSPMKLEKKDFKYLLNELYHRGRILFRRRLLFQSVVCTQTSFWSSHHNLVTTFFQLHTSMLY